MYLQNFFRNFFRNGLTTAKKVNTVSMKSCLENQSFGQNVRWVMEMVKLLGDKIVLRFTLKFSYILYSIFLSYSIP